jgi:hypothetical protein
MHWTHFSNPTKAPSDFIYRVTWRTIVDHPEKRDASYPKVSPGHVINSTKDFHKQRSAITLYNELLGGEWDFGSEYVNTAAVTRYYLDSYRRDNVRAQLRRDCRTCPWKPW